MFNLHKSKLANVLFCFVKTAPLLVLIGIIFRFLFIVLQVSSIWFIFGWVGGNVKPVVKEMIGLPVESYIYPCIGALGFILSTLCLLIGKMCSLKATCQFEKVIVEKVGNNQVLISKGDLKNIVKLLISVMDVMVPLALIVTVSALWIHVTPYMLILIFIMLCGGAWLLKKGVGFSAKRYKPINRTGKLESYVGSQEQQGFYKMLLLPNYIMLALMSIIAILIVTSLIATKLYFESHGGQIGYMAILTGVAFLQMRSFSNIVVRAGAYNKSLSAIYKAFFTKGT
ncbi:hypothetical protein QEN58_06095 [Halomonas alkaliantarctica]|uniref:ABC transporter transmembrane protein n=1 Tax=Halomonas alkaliantarctica TaxID=232346 RepID=A0ABY8LSL8_9GAMM|nr:hypothetical protein [Halomonas alkaliantarctica]WGI26629.1 hypothetical protein QEN58_06095 [Halomonas alkaliantarctica]